MRKPLAIKKKLERTGTAGSRVACPRLIIFCPPIFQQRSESSSQDSNIGGWRQCGGQRGFRQRHQLREVASKLRQKRHQIPSRSRTGWNRSRLGIPDGISKGSIDSGRSPIGRNKVLHCIKLSQLARQHIASPAFIEIVSWTCLCSARYINARKHFCPLKTAFVQKMSISKILREDEIDKNDVDQSLLTQNFKWITTLEKSIPTPRQFIDLFTKN